MIFLIKFLGRTNYRKKKLYIIPQLQIIICSHGSCDSMISLPNLEPLAELGFKV